MRRFLPPWLNSVTDAVKGSALVSLVGIVDLALIPSIVSMNLLFLGPVLTLLFLGVSIPMHRFMITSGFFSIAIGTLAVAASVVITKLRPTGRLWVKLSA